MGLRFWAMALSFAGIILFLLYGTLQLQWHREPDHHFRLKVSVDLSIPALHKRTGQALSWTDTLPTAFYDVFGEQATTGQQPWRPTDETTEDRITPKSVIHRLQHLVKVVPAPASESAGAKSLVPLGASLAEMAGSSAQNR